VYLLLSAVLTVVGLWLARDPAEESVVPAPEEKVLS
jgi:hypothetical protein